MGNNRSRIAPTRTFRLLDHETRARYLNQRETSKLNRRLDKIRDDHQVFLTRFTVAQFELRTTLRDMKYEEEQKKLSINIDQRARENSTTSSVVSDGSEIDIDTETESEIETNVSEEFPHSSIFLLHNLNETIKWEKNRPFAPKFENRRSSSSFDKCRINGTDRLTPVLMKDDRMKSVTQVKGTHQQNLTVGQRRQRQSSNRETLLNKK